MKTGFGCKLAFFHALEFERDIAVVTIVFDRFEDLPDVQVALSKDRTTDNRTTDSLEPVSSAAAKTRCV